MTAQEEYFFSEAEAFTALSWGMPEDEARKLAKFMANDPSVFAHDPEMRDQGPVAMNYSQDMLILLSLVSAETNAKVERYVEEARLGGVPWGSAERAAYDNRRAELREGLIKAGKIKDKE